MDMNKICRVCMKEDQDMLLIFEENYTNTELKMSIAAMLSEITIYKVQRFDELPHLICGACFKATQNAFALKRCCENSYRQLIALLGNDDLNFKSNNDENKLNNSTQTDDTCLYPCERCDEKFFTFYDLRCHRDKEHKAIFHPEVGLQSHVQCHICKRQFTRRQHLKRHLALMHKCDEHAFDLNDVDTMEEQILAKSMFSEEESDQTKMACLNVTEEKNCESDSENDNVDTQVDISNCIRPKTEDEDIKPVTEFLNNNPTSGFTEVLLNNSFEEYNLSENPIDPTEIKYEEFQPSCQSNLDTLFLPKKRGRGRPPRKSDTGITITIPKNVKEFMQEKTESNLKRHKLNHNICCNICSQKFSNSDLLKDHMQAAHSASKVLNCDNDNQLKKHKETKHQEKGYKCDKCNKGFKTKPLLKRHLVTHGNKRYVCKECLQDFSSKEELNSHIKLEGHDKPLLCPECGLRCKTSTILLVHMRRHTGEKPFKCKFCSKGFPRMDDLRVHEKYHTGEKSHFCETCGKGFQRKYNLTIHLRVHTGEKPYKCPHCQQAFAQGNDLKAHIRRHTGERFRCDICGGTFLQGYQIRQHKLTEHGIKDIPPTQRVAKFTSREAQEKQIQQNLQKELQEANAMTGTTAESTKVQVDSSS